MLLHGYTVFIDSIAWQVYLIIPEYACPASVKLNLLEQPLHFPQQGIPRQAHIILYVIQYPFPIIERYGENIIRQRLNTADALNHRITPYSSGGNLLIC